MEEVKWKYISTEDLKLFKGKVSNELYWKLAAQCRGRIPMLLESYNQLVKKYINIYK